MIQPLVPRVDLFAAVQLSGAAAGDTKTRELLARHAVASVYRQRSDSISSFNSHTLCLQLIEGHEKRSRAQRRYEWVMRVRTDIAYGSRITSRLPALAPSAPPTVWVEGCGVGGSTQPAVCPRYGTDGLLGCAKDTWALCTRDAATVYFNSAMLSASPNTCHRHNRTTKTTAAVRTTSALTSHQSTNLRLVNECRLGCTLHRGNVTIRTLPLSRLIVRNSSIRLPVPNRTIRTWYR